MQARLEEDFRLLHSLGFNAVWPDFVTETNRDAAADAATRAGLRAILPDLLIDRYTTFGALPPHLASPHDLVTSRVESLRREQATPILVLPPFPHASMIDRAHEIARLAAELRPACEVLLVGHSADAARFADLPTIWYAARQTTKTPHSHIAPAPRLIELAAPIHGTGAAWSEVALRLAYYRGLRSGLTDGLLVWRFRSWPGELNGFAEADGRIAPGALAGLKSLIRRANEWEPILKSARYVPDETIRMDADTLRWSLLGRHGRRFILVNNEDTERFARGTLRIPPTLAGLPVSRAVAQDTGSRYLRGGGALTISIRLAPAEAVLFEVH